MNEYYNGIKLPTSDTVAICYQLLFNHWTRSGLTSISPHLMVTWRCSDNERFIGSTNLFSVWRRLTFLWCPNCSHYQW